MPAAFLADRLAALAAAALQRAEACDGATVGDERLHRQREGACLVVG